MHVKYNRKKNEFVENVLPAISALCINVSTHCDETVKYLDYTRNSQLTGWCRGKASASGARGLGSISGFSKGFMFDILFCCCVCFTFLVKELHYLSHKFAISFAMLINLVYLTYFKMYD